MITLSCPTVMSRDATLITRQMNRYSSTTNPIFSASRSCSTKAALEREAGLAHADHVAVHERGLGDPLAVHLGAVRGSKVDQRIAVADPADLRVTAGHVGVGEHDRAFARPS